MTTIDYYLEYLLSENWFFVRFCVTQLSNRNLLRSDIFKIGTKSFKLFVISSINVKQKRNQRIPKVPILTAICNFVSQRDKHTIFFVKSYKIQYPISFLSCNHMYIQKRKSTYFANFEIRSFLPCAFAYFFVKSLKIQFPNSFSFVKWVGKYGVQKMKYFYFSVKLTYYRF